jgi:hypothetical protein
MLFSEIARTDPSCVRRGWRSAVLAVVLLAGRARGQTCLSAEDLDRASRTALESAARQYFDQAAKGDVATLRQNAIPSLAANFGGIEAAVKERQESFAGATATARPPFLLEAEGKEPLERAEFLCGVFGKSGQTANSAVFVIPNLPPGTYGAVILDVGSKVPSTLSFVLQKVGNDWKLAGFYARPAQIAGHDGKWFWDRAREFKAKGLTRNAWLYYLEARDLMAPVPVMSTMTTDKIYDEMQSVQPTDLPTAGNTVDLAVAGKTRKLTSAFPVGVGNDLDLVVKYAATDVSNANQTFQDNVALIHALVAKYPELQDGFAAIIARAVEPSGKDYGTMVEMKEIK